MNQSIGALLLGALLLLAVAGCQPAGADPAASRLAPGSTAIVAGAPDAPISLRTPKNEYVFLHVGDRVLIGADTAHAANVSDGTGGNEDNRRVEVSVQSGSHAGVIGSMERRALRPAPE